MSESTYSFMLPHLNPLCGCADPLTCSVDSLGCIYIGQSLERGYQVGRKAFLAGGGNHGRGLAFHREREAEDKGTPTLGCFPAPHNPCVPFLGHVPHSVVPMKKRADDGTGQRSRAQYTNERNQPP